MTAFSVIQDVILTALNDIPPLANGCISTNRTRPIPAGQNTAIVLRLDQSEGSEISIGVFDWQTTLTVECYARATPGTDPATAINNLLGEVWTRLTEIVPATTPADIQIMPEINWQYDDTDTPSGSALIRLIARHRTTSNTLSAP